MPLACCARRYMHHQARAAVAGSGLCTCSCSWVHPQAHSRLAAGSQEPAHPTHAHPRTHPPNPPPTPTHTHTHSFSCPHFPRAGEGSSGLSGGAVAGIVISLLVAAGLVAGLVVYIKKKRHLRSQASVWGGATRFEKFEGGWGQGPHRLSKLCCTLVFRNRRLNGRRQGGCCKGHNQWGAARLRHTCGGGERRRGHRSLPIALPGFSGTPTHFPHPPHLTDHTLPPPTHRTAPHPTRHMTPVLSTLRCTAPAEDDFTRPPRDLELAGQRGGSGGASPRPYDTANTRRQGFHFPDSP